jgi:GNAT superfamily N-acetyltransferase
MKLAIREFQPTDEEYQAIAKLDGVVWPDYATTAAEFRFEDETQDPKYISQSVVAESNGEIVAFGWYEETYWSYQPGKYMISCRVHPKHERKGIGTAFYEYVMEKLVGHGATKFVASSREDKPQGIRFLEKRGFKQEMRVPISLLDVTRFNPGPFASAIEKAKKHGITFCTLAELEKSDPDWKQKILDLRWQIVQDVPSPEPPSQIPLETYDKQVYQNPKLFKEGWVIAMDGDKYVGYSNLWKMPGKPGKLNTGLTGVMRSYRRMGICTAVKLQAIDAARRLGITQIETDNEENNPMYQINLGLGFQPRPAWLSFMKVIKK